jgi:hypothetical protein
MLMHLGEEDEFISKERKRRSNPLSPANQTRRSTAIRVSITHFLGTTGRTTMPRRPNLLTTAHTSSCIDIFECRASLPDDYQFDNVPLSGSVPIVLNVTV